MVRAQPRDALGRGQLLELLGGEQLCSTTNLRIVCSGSPAAAADAARPGARPPRSRSARPARSAWPCCCGRAAGIARGRPRCRRRTAGRRCRRRGPAGRATVNRLSATSGRNWLSSRLPADDRLDDHQVVAHHGHGRLGHRLGDHRVDLAGHDRRAGLAGRQADFAQPGVRAGREQPQIVGRSSAGSPARVRRMPLTSMKTSAFCVASTRFSARASPRPVICRKCSTTRKTYCRGAPSAGADGRAAQVHHAEPLLALVDPPAVAGEGLGVGATSRGPAS